MANKIFEDVNMLEVLIEAAASGKKVELQGKPDRKVVRFEREGRKVDTVILSMAYSGTIDGKSFAFKKDYSFADDEAQYALDCLLIANNRLLTDYDRLKDAGIAIEHDLFTFQNSFIGLKGDASVKSPALRLQNFIHFAQTGIPISVDVELKRPSIIVKQEDGERKGFGLVATFIFTTGWEKTTIEKIYGTGAYDDPKKYQEELKEVANRRLERDCERLRRAGIEVEPIAF
ncbi:MAG: hypothetical protein JRL30_00150 [Deltaproteobacteria bacterium]|nr:hypothetical protein [Deltaproteobacteria bacterium]